MTEDQWSDCIDFEVLLAFLQRSGKLSERKARLFSCGSVRQVWHLLDDKESREAVEVAERYADGFCTGGELVSAEHQANAVRFTLDRLMRPLDYPAFAASVVAGQDMTIFTSPGFLGARKSFRSGVAAREGVDQGRMVSDVFLVLLRDLFGPLPFRDVRIDPSCLTWQGGTAVRMAEAVYEERHRPAGTLDSGRLLIFADALEEAGCTDVDILSHLRGPGPHVRGCWPVDLVLGKS